ncbi:MAG TPA: 2-C-methyl-D-erythritol 4-phosphate cytidylyltransferase, partial [Dehalococcoidia bacterium]|nr:2-C-methyl-D-erythritol 4-phosphate cytidylyltransferase [Dehalococcoidia bacterium]
MAVEPRPGGDALPNNRASVIVVAAGQSTRMGDVDKTFASVLGIPLIAHTLSPFESCPLIDEIVLVLSQENLDHGREILQDHNFSKVSLVCAGGKRRQDSVRNGLEALQPCQWVLVHDGARPCLDQSLLERGMAAARETGAAVAGMPVKDTIKMVSAERMVTGTPPRESLWAAQTPQIFRYDLLRRAHHTCTETMTDDAA